MADADHQRLLRRFRPALLYDSQEAYFADHPAQMVVNPGNILRRKDGKGARTDDGTLTLATLAPTYVDGEKASKHDVLAIAGKDYRKQYAALRESHPELRNHIVARARRDSEQRLWLQYWLWYFYNDYRLAADYGLHEGDWELVQLRLGDDEDPDAAQPDYAVYAQHAKAQRRPWDQVHKDPDNADAAQVYVARGSHASYFHAGVFPTEVWADVCDAGRPSPPSTLLIIGDHPQDWAGWPGRWGDTTANTTGLDKSLTSNSPDGPCRKPHFQDPMKLFDDASEFVDTKDPLPGPDFQVGRRDGRLLVTYNVTRVTGVATAVIINVNSSQEHGTPPKTYTYPITATGGRIVTPIPVDAARTYDVWLSVDVRTADGTVLPSVTVSRCLDPGDHEPQRIPTTKLGVVLVPAIERLKKLLGR
ncbi:MAG TPA: hypothetical protein VFY45_17770 [Baekduia sp.]|nr:hypothetical protein [Baekduia sp.]